MTEINSVQYYRRKPGCSPSIALTWYSVRLFLNVASTDNAAIMQTLADVMNMDAGEWIGFARVPGEGWKPAVEAATHQRELFHDCTINQWSSGKGTIRLCFDVQGRFVPLLGKLLLRQMLRHVKPTAGVELSVSYYVDGHPLWDEIVPPEPDDPTSEPAA